MTTTGGAGHAWKILWWGGAACLAAFRPLSAGGIGSNRLGRLRPNCRRRLFPRVILRRQSLSGMTGRSVAYLTT